MSAHEAMDLQTVADLLGVSTRQINNYINLKGLPSHGSGKRRTFVWPDVLEWYVGYRAEMELGPGNGGSDDADFAPDTSVTAPRGKEDIRAANLRKTTAEANLKELALARQRGQVIVIADAKLRLDRLFGNVRARLLGMPPKLASRIEALTSRTDRESAIKQEMEALCREIATGAVVDLPREDAAAISDTDPAAEETLELSAAAEQAKTEQAAQELLESYDSLE